MFGYCEPTARNEDCTGSFLSLIDGFLFEPELLILTDANTSATVWNL